MTEDIKKDLKESVDFLLSSDPAINELDQNVLPDFKPKIAPVKYDEQKQKSTNKAKHVVTTLLKFYLSEEVINKNDYIKAKANLEAATLSNLINQVKIADRAIQILMSSIDGGETSPRMFEVLGGLQRTMLDIMKHQTLQILATEESMKKIKRDLDIYSDDKPKRLELSGGQGQTQARGTRNLMKEIQDELGNE